MTTGIPATADLDALRSLARKIRGRVVRMSHVARTPHLGSSLSCVDILVAAYWGALRIDPAVPFDPGRDRFILSKGHAATALYATLACRGFFDQSHLDTFACDGGRLGEHPSLHAVAGVEASTGSLGHGLSLALGMALAQRIQGRNFRCFVLMSDGECQEGTVWEAAMFAAARRIENVVAIVDYNKWQATGRTNEIMAMEPLAEKWRAFGWTTHEVDGHDLASLLPLIDHLPDGSGRPVAVIAHTVKGKGVSFMEDDNNWHYRIPTAEEVRAAHQELGLT
jgi:transketolase